MPFLETKAFCVKTGTFYRKLDRYNIVSVSRVKNMRLKNNTKVVEILHQRHTKNFNICTPCAQIYIQHPF